MIHEPSTHIPRRLKDSASALKLFKRLLHDCKGDADLQGFGPTDPLDLQIPECLAPDSARDNELYRAVRPGVQMPYSRSATLGATMTPFGRITAKSTCWISPSAVSATVTSQCGIGFCRKVALSIEPILGPP